MKRLFILIMLIFMIGCSEKTPSVNSSSTIILKIISEVNPHIVSSSGEGVYDQANKQYTLNVSSTKPVDISLSYEDYETVTVSIPTTDLIKGHVVKEVEFKTLKTAIVEIYVKTEAKTEEIQLTGYDFIQKGKKFTINLPSRKEHISLEFKINEEYRLVNLDIEPKDLVTGFYKKEIEIIRKDQVFIYFDIGLYGRFDSPLISINTEKEYYGVNNQNIVTYVVDKDDEVIYFNERTFEYYYLKTEKDMLIELDFDYIYNFKQFELTNFNLSEYEGLFFYEFNNRRYEMSFTQFLGRISTRIPFNAKILYVEYVNHYYHQGFNPEGTMIDFSRSSFIEYDYRFDLKLIDYKTKLPIMQIDDHIANDKGFFEGFRRILHLEGYIEKDINPILDARLINDKWVIEKTIIPKVEGFIMNFIDQNGNSVDIDIESNSFIKLDNNQRLLNEYSILEGNRLDIDQINFRYEDKNLTVKVKLFLEMFNFIEIDGKLYFQLINPIKINTDVYEIYIGIEIDNFQDNLFFDSYILKNGKIINSHKQITGFISGYQFELGDIFTLVTIYGNNKKEIDIIITEEIIASRMINYNYNYHQFVEPNTIIINLSSKIHFISYRYFDGFSFIHSSDDNQIIIKFIGASTIVRIYFENIDFNNIFDRDYLIDKGVNYINLEY